MTFEGHSKFVGSVFIKRIPVGMQVNTKEKFMYILSLIAIKFAIKSHSRLFRVRTREGNV